MRQYWIVGSSGEPEGPFVEAAVIEGVSQGRWSSSAFVCEVGSENWVPLESMPNLEFSAPAVEKPARVDRATRSSEGAWERKPVDLDKVEVWLLLPERAIERLLQVLKQVISEAIVERVSSRAQRTGLAALPIAAIAIVVWILDTLAPVAGFRTVAGLLSGICVGTCLLQFMAKRFLNEAEIASGQTPIGYSRETIFDAAGLTLIAGGAVLVGMSVNTVSQSLRDASLDWSSFLLVVLGVMAIAMGGTFLNPACLKMRKRQASTLGQDGIAIIAAIGKSILKAVRLAFGFAMATGTLLCWYGMTSFVVANEPGDTLVAVAWQFAGIGLLAGGAVLPLLAYLLAMVLFVVVEVLSHLLGGDIEVLPRDFAGADESKVS